MPKDGLSCTKLAIQSLVYHIRYRHTLHYLGGGLTGSNRQCKIDGLFTAEFAMQIIDEMARERTGHPLSYATNTSYHGCLKANLRGSSSTGQNYS